jgi:hypothetical protein
LAHEIEAQVALEQMGRDLEPWAVRDFPRQVCVPSVERAIVHNSVKAGPVPRCRLPLKEGLNLRAQERLIEADGDRVSMGLEPKQVLRACVSDEYADLVLCQARGILLHEEVGRRGWPDRRPMGIGAIALPQRGVLVLSRSPEVSVEDLGGHQR